MESEKKKICVGSRKSQVRTLYFDIDLKIRPESNLDRHVNCVCSVVLFFA